jgi:hypothetical protein
MVFPPAYAADDPFPVSTTSPFSQTAVPTDGADGGAPANATDAATTGDAGIVDSGTRGVTDPGTWRYALEFHDTFDSGVTDAGPRSGCTGQGSIAGAERHCLTGDGNCANNASAICGAGAGDGVECNALTGLYAIGSSDNRIDIDIDRGDPSGPEHYAGGWTAPRGAFVLDGRGPDPRPALATHGARPFDRPRIQGGLSRGLSTTPSIGRDR